MEQFKIDHYLKDNPGKSFPGFKKLSKLECNIIITSLRNKLMVPDNTSGAELVKIIDKRQTSIKEENAEDDNFSLIELFRKNNISLGKEIYINWYHYDQIDQFKKEDLLNFFDDIWYPSSDDIDIFDEKMENIVSIDHGGFIKILQIHQK